MGDREVQAGKGGQGGKGTEARAGKGGQGGKGQAGRGNWRMLRKDGGGRVEGVEGGGMMGRDRDGRGLGILSPKISEFSSTI